MRNLASELSTQYSQLSTQLRPPETQFQKQESLPLKLPSGDQSEVEPPGPIPNPEVKRLSANGSGTIGPVRVGRRQVFARIQLTLGPGSFFARMPGPSPGSAPRELWAPLAFVAFPTFIAFGAEGGEAGSSARNIHPSPTATFHVTTVTKIVAAWKMGH